VAPVSGEIVQVNEELEEDTSLINSDPYGEGWILEIEATDLENELKNLMQGEALTEFIEAEYRRAEEERAKE
jgi:glycine cleavage system H protein